ncbi:MAG: hypothetical protein FWD47_14360 [Treponema sp.]|nr:hypothetical protein [Treponema sp.]
MYKKYILITFCLYILFFISCDYGTCIILDNNTNKKIIIEIKTIYDQYIYGSIGGYRGYVDWKNIYPKKHGYFTILAAPFELDANNYIDVLYLSNQQVIDAFGYGSVKSKKDIIRTIDEIFLEMNIYYEGENEKIFLYDKSYFLNEDIIEIRKQKFPAGHNKLYNVILYINNNREVLEN